MKNIDNQDFDIYKALMPYCKRHLPHSPDRPKEIDFITLENDLEMFHEAQRKVCEEIVDVVDKHLEEFYNLAGKMQSIQTLLSSTDQLYTRLAERVRQATTSLTKEESKLKQSLEVYEIKELQTSLMEGSREALHFLIRFNDRFESIKVTDYEKLPKRDTNLLIKFSFRVGYLRRVLEHHLVRSHLRHMEGAATLESLELEFEAYISEQLIRLSQTKEYTIEDCSIRMCYQNLKKEDEFFRVIEEHLVWNELRVVEAELLTNKASIISSQDPSLLESFFKNLFLLVGQLPQGFPKRRMVALLKSFLNKKEFNFLYTYTLPIFPLAFKCFCNHVHLLSNPQMEEELMRTHKWNIKMWVDVKAQDILRKSLNDDITKWLQLVFKEQNFLEGVKAKLIKTALLMIGRYSANISNAECSEAEYPATLSRLVEETSSVPQMVKTSLSKAGIEASLISTFVQQITSKLQSALDSFLSLNLQLVLNSTISVLCNTNSFLNKVLHRNQTESIHAPSVVFKSLNAHLRNFPELSKKASQSVRRHVMRELEGKYGKLQEEIGEYSATNMTLEQREKIAVALKKDKESLFEGQLL